MKVATSALLIGAAAAATTPQQQVLKAPHDAVNGLKDASSHVSDSMKHASESWADQLHNLGDSLSHLTGEARAIWDEVAMMFPEAMDKASFFSSPKEHTRRPDHEWDHILHGEDIQSVWVENAKGEKEREIEGKLEAYSMRTKKVDPSALGIDPDVKQYSGYLDDNENDKHLFYCKRNSSYLLSKSNELISTKGSSSLEMILRTIQSFYGSTVAPAAPP